MEGVWKIITSIVKFVQGIGTVFLGLFVLLILLLWVAAAQGPQKPSFEDGSILVLAPTGVVVEQTDVPEPFAKAFGQTTPETSFHGMMRALRTAKDDGRISALAIDTDTMAGAAPAHLHAAVRDFKTSGKKVYAISTSYTQAGYMLAAEADKIYLNGEGSVLLTGFGTYPLYYKSLYDKIEATVNVFKVGTYKSAVEPSTRDSMSDAAREANIAFLNTLWDQYLESVASARETEAAPLRERINNISDELRQASGDFADMALSMGLVDQISSRNDWRQELMEEYGTSGNSFKQVNHKTYLASLNGGNNSSNHVAVITAQGTIVMGRGPVSVAAAETLVEHIRNARKNRNTKAIVLRVDSPGGSAFASELIREELAAAQNQGIPVVASMGPVAASGGYWISATADEIWAAPSTITGSIGIFAVVPTFEKTLAKVGVNTDGVGTTPLAGGFNVLGGLNDTTKDILQQSIENGYSDFLNLVAQGRNMSVEDVDKIAQGRVWAGVTAKELGLVDNLGSFDDAVAAAARLAELDDYRTVFYRERPTQYEVFLNQVLDEVSIDVPQTALLPVSELSPLLEAAKELEGDIKVMLEVNDPMYRYVVCVECKVR